MKVVTRFLEPEEFHLTDEYFDHEGVPRLDPEWSKIVATVDEDTGRVLGVMCLQMVAHVEPIIIDPEHRGQGLWRDMAEMIDGYMAGVGLAGAYCQPLNPKSKAIAEKMGFQECEAPLFSKMYDKNYLALRISGELQITEE